jgi:hypothetical protein
MKLQGSADVVAFNPYSTGSVPEHDLGQEIALTDGRVFRYAKAGGSNISAGKLQLAPAPKTNHHNVAWASGGAINTNKVTVTLGATAAVADEYAEGLLVVNDATGEGTSYQISGHPAAGSGATLEVTVFGSIHTALVTGSEMTLVHNRYRGVVEGTSQTQIPAGVPLVNIAANNYGWLQVRGVAPVLADTAIAVGSAVAAGTSTAGAVELEDWAVNATDATRLQVEFHVGYAIVAGVDTEYRPIFLEIA